MRNKICHKENPQWSASRREWSANHIEREDSDKAGVAAGAPQPPDPITCHAHPQDNYCPCCHITQDERQASQPKQQASASVRQGLDGLSREVMHGCLDLPRGQGHPAALPVW